MQGSNWVDDAPLPVHVSLGPLHLSAGAITGMVDDLRGWLSLSLPQLALTPLECRHDLAFSPPSSLSLGFGPEPGSSAGGKALITVSFSVGNLSGEQSFTTDQTSVASFTEGLLSGLRRSGALDHT
jgi:hypothetical protein